MYELYGYYVISRTDVLQNAAIDPINGTRALFFSPVVNSVNFFFFFLNGQLPEHAKIQHPG